MSRESVRQITIVARQISVGIATSAVTRGISSALLNISAAVEWFKRRNGDKTGLARDCLHIPRHSRLCVIYVCHTLSSDVPPPPTPFIIHYIHYTRTLSCVTEPPTVITQKYMSPIKFYQHCRTIINMFFAQIPSSGSRLQIIFNLTSYN